MHTYRNWSLELPEGPCKKVDVHLLEKDSDLIVYYCLHVFTIFMHYGIEMVLYSDGSV